MGLFSLKRGDSEGTLQQSLTVSKTVIERKEKNLLTILVVDRAGSNRLKLQQQGFRLDMSLTIRFSSLSLSLGSFKFTDMDMQPTLTEKAVVTAVLHYCSHVPIYIHGMSLLLCLYHSPAYETGCLSLDLFLSLNTCVLLHEVLKVLLFLILSLSVWPSRLFTHACGLPVKDRKMNSRYCF